jgi:diaminopimelate epimerase
VSADALTGQRGERVFKYHGLGNDFVILDRRASGMDIDARRAQELCDRRRGIGADGVLVLLPSSVAAARMNVHNSDGSEAEMCGNGIRCVVKYLVDHATDKPSTLSLETGAGLLQCKVEYRDRVAHQIEVDMGPARLVADDLPTIEPGRPFVDAELPGLKGVRGTAVSMGNPHLVLFGRPLAEAGTLGPKLEVHPAFPAKTNVELTQVENGGLRIAVWERGAGLTQACGTGACAAVAAAVYEHRLSPEKWIRVELPGGVLEVRARADLSSVVLRGPATYVFEAMI